MKLSEWTKLRVIQSFLHEFRFCEIKFLGQIIFQFIEFINELRDKTKLNQSIAEPLLSQIASWVDTMVIYRLGEFLFGESLLGEIRFGEKI
jgi:hypothetical protein